MVFHLARASAGSQFALVSYPVKSKTYAHRGNPTGHQPGDL